MITRQLSKLICAAVAACTLAVTTHSARAEDTAGAGIVPSFYTSLGAGGVFYDHGEELMHTLQYEAKLGLRYNEWIATEMGFAGLPAINHRTYDSPAALDDDTWGMKVALDALYHPWGSDMLTFDPFLAVTFGSFWFEDNKPWGGNADPYVGTGLGMFWNFSEHYFARGDYRVVTVFNDTEWNHHALLSLGYRWGAPAALAAKAGEKDAGESDLRGDANPALQTIYFAFDSSKLDDAAKQRLDANAKWMKENPGTSLTLEGHCDERGTNEYNLALGERRAQTSYKYLVTLGINKDQLRTQSFGEEFPADPGHDEGAWSKNRRVEFREKK